jgi:hypothetical protein
MHDNDTRDARHHYDDPHSKLALSWHGFGSPVGLGILAISIGIAAVLLRIAIIGF